MERREHQGDRVVGAGVDIEDQLSVAYAECTEVGRPAMPLQGPCNPTPLTGLSAFREAFEGVPA